MPEQLQPKLDFESLYDAFGGKLVHWADYVTDFGKALVLSRRPLLTKITVNANGDFSGE